MAIIKCKMCGGDVELAADKTFGTCEFCGNTMTFPKVDDDQRAAAFNRGNHFRRIGEFDKALAVYERIVREDETDAEAHWCCALCRFGIEYVEDPATFEWLPTCHRASFDSFLEDVDYLAAVEHSEGITKRQYQKDAAKIAEVQRGILATSQNTEPYDVFICYKESDANGDRTRDSLLAQDIYYQLTEQGRKVFFARITLEDVVGSQYEPYIFAALNSAKVMIVVGTQPEYLNAVWVKNEWSRFLALMKKDRSKLLLPCYRDMDPYDLPEQLSVLQSYDMSKIGFIQDLIRGIAKVLDAEKKPEPVVRETVTIQQANSNVVALIKRGNMALEDGEWDKADQFFEEVLNQDAECSEAYLGSFLAQKHCVTLVQCFEKEMEQLKVAVQTEEKNTEQEALGRQQCLDQLREEYVAVGLIKERELMELWPKCTPYRSELAYWKEQRVLAEDYLASNKQLQRAAKFADAAQKTELNQALDKWFKQLDGAVQEAVQMDEEQEAQIVQQMGERIQQVRAAAEQAADRVRAMIEAQYQNLCKKQETCQDVWSVRTLRNSFEALGSYKDCQKRTEWCRSKLAELDEENRQREHEYKMMGQWVSQGKCAYCGGDFAGLFNKKCTKCGRLKSY